MPSNPVSLSRAHQELPSSFPFGSINEGRVDERRFDLVEDPRD